MAIEKTVRAERIAIFLQPDGSLKGAHQERIEEWVEGGEVLSVTQLPAEPLTAEALASVLPSRAALSAQVQALTTALDEMTADRNALAAKLALLEPSPEPVVSALQARIALKRAGLFTKVQSLMATLPEDSEARMHWEYAVTFQRNNPVLLEMAEVLSLSSEQIDDLFALAGTIR